MNSLNRALLKKLSDDPVRFCNQIGFLSQYPADSVEYAGESFFFRGKSDYLWIFFAVREKKDLYKLKKKLTVKDRNFASVPVHFLNELELPGASSAFIAGQYFLPRDVNIYRKNDFADTLHVGDASYVYAAVKQNAWYSLDYLVERITMGPSVCVRDEKGDPIAWTGTHDDGAMGFLYVRQEYRGKGLAKKISRILAGRIRSVRKVPFVQIEPGNTASIHLSKSMGFRYMHDVCWIDKDM